MSTARRASAVSAARDSLVMRAAIECSSDSEGECSSSLPKKADTALTLVSRVTGFARDALLARAVRRELDVQLRLEPQRRDEAAQLRLGVARVHGGEGRPQRVQHGAAAEALRRELVEAVRVRQHPAGDDGAHRLLALLDVHVVQVHRHGDVRDRVVHRVDRVPQRVHADLVREQDVAQVGGRRALRAAWVRPEPKAPT